MQEQSKILIIPEQPNENLQPVVRIRAAAMALLQESGARSFTTRAICERAGVTAPTLYHHYGDKDGLLRELAKSALQQFFALKGQTELSDDAEQDVKQGWDDWIDFAIDHIDLVRAIQAPGTNTTVPFRQMAEAIVERRLIRLSAAQKMVIAPPTGALLLVAGANTVVQLLLDGMAIDEVKVLSAIVRDGLVQSLIDSRACD